MLGERVEIHLRLRGGVEIPARYANRALAQSLGLVGADEVGVHRLAESEPEALGAGAVGRVEGKEPRLDFLERDTAVGTGVIDGIKLLFSLARVVDDHQAVCQLKRGFEAVRQAFLYPRLDDETIDDDGNIVLEVLFQLDFFL